MCFQALESHTERTNPSVLLLALCQDINSINDEHLTYVLAVESMEIDGAPYKVLWTIQQIGEICILDKL
jgi:hypothetical protein